MPDQPLHIEFGKPMAEGTKTSDEVFNERYGTYQNTWGTKQGSTENPAKQHDPKPFEKVK